MEHQPELDEFFSLLGKMFLINLPERKDRRTEFEEQLQKIGLSSSDPQIRIFKAERPTDAAGFPTVGARGCFLSHLGVLRTAIACGEEHVLICEDDLDFSTEFKRRIPHITRELRSQDWSIFYGGHGSPIGGQSVAPQLFEVDPDNAIMCTHFYSVRGNAIKDLVDYLEAILSRAPGDPAGGPMHVDGALSRFRAEFPQYRTLAVSPPLGFQRSSRTDIHANQWFDRIPIVKNGAGAIRRLRNLMREI